MPSYRITTANGGESRGTSSMSLDEIAARLQEVGHVFIDVTWASTNAPVAAGRTIFLRDTICTMSALAG
jgi:hypothetical protein